MVPTWNGIFGRETILELLSYTTIGPFEGIYSYIHYSLTS